MYREKTLKHVCAAALVFHLTLALPTWGGEETLEYAAPSDLRVACFGDSITAGKYPDYLGEILSDIEVVKAGVGGNTTGAGLARMAEDVLDHQPDVVLIMFGTNDSVLWKEGHYRTPLDAFEKNLRAMVARCRVAGAEPVLATLLPIIAAPYYTRHPREFYEPEGGLAAILERYRKVTMAVASDLDVPLVDMYTRISGDLTHLKPDGVHPNEAGEKAIAVCFAEAVQALRATPAVDPEV